MKISRIGEMNKVYEELIEVRSNHKRNTTILSYSILTAILIWISVFGLILPLNNLSSYDENAKSHMLIIFSVGLLLLPFYLIFEIIVIWMKKKIEILNPKLLHN
jgi:hypothetical protein